MKGYERMTTLLFLLIVFGFSLLFFVMTDHSFSEQENRSLQTTPSLSAEKMLSGKFSSEMNAYFSDQFPWRDGLVEVKSALELMSGKGENDGILLGERGRLARCRFDIQTSDGVLRDSDCYDSTHVQKACQGISRAAANTAVPFHVLLTGRNIDVTSSSFDFPFEYSEKLLTEVRLQVSDHAQTVETIPLLREKHEDEEYVYYKTDHHWTTLGAYYGYVEIMESFGLASEIIPAELFEKHIVSDSFYGTLWSAGGMKWVAPDSVEFWYFGNEDDFVVVADERELNGFYSEKWLSKKDHYSCFLDGTHDVVTISRKDGSSRPKLLLIKDSFANSVAPFLAQHFDIVLLNLSSSKHDFTNVSQLARDYQADRVLLIYTLENLITSDKLCRLQ